MESRFFVGFIEEFESEYTYMEDGAGIEPEGGYLLVAGPDSHRQACHQHARVKGGDHQGDPVGTAQHHENAQSCQNGAAADAVEQAEFAGNLQRQNGQQQVSQRERPGKGKQLRSHHNVKQQGDRIYGAGHDQQKLTFPQKFSFVFCHTPPP